MGAMVKMPQVAAQDRYGAGLLDRIFRAIQKADDSFRVIHDGTHGTGVNGNIHVVISSFALQLVTSVRLCAPLRTPPSCSLQT